MRPFSGPASGLPFNKRVNEFLADLIELAAKHFPSRIDRTRISEEDGFMKIALKNGKAGSEMELSGLADGIEFVFASVRWRLGGEAGPEALFARAAGELLGILSGERVMARIGSGEACRGTLVPRGMEAEAAASLRAAGPAGEPVILKGWNAAAAPAPGEGE